MFMSPNSPSVAQSNLINKIADIDQECLEHNIVLEELLALNERDSENSDGGSCDKKKERVCYRLINNVLIKKSITEIIKELQDSKQNMLKLSKVLENRLHELSQEAKSS